MATRLHMLHTDTSHVTEFDNEKKIRPIGFSLIKCNYVKALNRHQEVIMNNIHPTQDTVEVPH